MITAALKRDEDAMLLRLLQISAIALTGLILFGLKEGATALGHFFGPGFAAGNLFGAAFVIVAYLLICWLDPSSRPRGSGPKH